MVQSDATGCLRREIASPRDKAPGRLVLRFQSAYKVAQSLQLARKESDSSQAALQHARNQQLSYVMQARDAPQILPEDVVQHQLAIAEVATAEVVNEQQSPSARARRNSSRADHLQELRTRHAFILENYQMSADELHSTFHEDVDITIRNLAQHLNDAEASGARLINHISSNGNIGAEKEETIQELLSALESCTTYKKQIVERHRRLLEDIELQRRNAFLEAIQNHIIMLNDVAHVSPGEIQRWGDGCCITVNEILLTNAKERSELIARLRGKVVYDHKVWRTEWYDLLSTWKRLRHRRALSVVFSRIHSREFIHPNSISVVFARMSDIQFQTYQQRLQVMASVFDTDAEAISSQTCRNNEELLNHYNDSAQEAFDMNFAELKRVKDGLNEEGFQMLRELEMQVDNLDARKEWGSHDGANELVEIDVAPHLTKRLDFVSRLLLDVSSVLQDMDESQHHCSIGVVKFVNTLAILLDKFKNELNDFRVQHQGELDDKVDDHIRECARNEQLMLDLHDIMDDTAHLTLLDDRLQSVFDQLDTIEESYRRFERDMVAIHSRFEPECTRLFTKHALALGSPLGLVAANENETDFSNEMSDKGAKENVQRISSHPQWRPDAYVEFSFSLGESMSAQDLCCQLMQVPVAAEGDAGAVEEGGGDEEMAIEKSAMLIPRGSDGKQCVRWLYVHSNWLERRLDKIRGSVFNFLQQCLDVAQDEGAVAFAKAEEELSRQLEERLRRHVNRRGEVQVEWFQPRKQQIEKHRETLRRHFLFIATKNSNHDRQFDDVNAKFELFAQEYSAGLKQLATDLSRADSLAFLTSLERKAKDLFSKFQDGQRKLLSVLRVITEQATAQLKCNNADFLKMCSPAEKYSVSEVLYFTEQMELLNESIDKLVSGRRFTVADLTDRSTSLAEGPLSEFSTKHAAAVEALCQRDGLGRKYGAPRRAAQEQVRSLIARAQNASHALGVFFWNYFVKLARHGSEGPSEEGLLCKGSFRRTDLHPMPCAMELRGCYAVSVSAVRILCCHLGALTQEFESQLVAPAVVPSLVDEASYNQLSLLGGSDGVFVEDELFKSQMDCILSSVVTANAFQTTVASVREQALKHFKGNLPHFMVSSLASMETSAQKNRQDICRELRIVCDQLRGDAAIACVRQAFNDLHDRSLESLIARLGSCENEFRDKCVQSKLLRCQHEKELRPSLANPQCVHLLSDLKMRETQRHDAFLSDIAAAHNEFKNVLVYAADIFVRSAQATMEAYCCIMDTIPLWPHFGSVPGDEQLEQSRMSIKRLQRRLAIGDKGPVDQTGQHLPKRSWEGMPARLLQLQSSWHVEILSEASAPTENRHVEDTPAVDSFRSSAHKALFSARNVVFDSFVDVFQARQKQLMLLIQAKLAWELSGQKHWEHMLTHLLNGEVEESDA